MFVYNKVVPVVPDIHHIQPVAGLTPPADLHGGDAVKVLLIRAQCKREVFAVIAEPLSSNKGRLWMVCSSVVKGACRL